MAKPATLPRWATDGGATLAPSSGHQDTGWVDNERPPARIFNWLWYWIYQWLLWLDSVMPNETVAPLSTVVADKHEIANARARTNLRNSTCAFNAAYPQFSGACASQGASTSLSAMRFFLCGYGGKVWSASEAGSASGTTLSWGTASAAGGYVGNFKGVLWHGGLNVVYGDTGEIQTFPDGTSLSLTQRKTGGSNVVAMDRDLAGGFLLALAANGHLFSSTSGVTWTDQGLKWAGADAVDIAVGRVAGAQVWAAVGISANKVSVSTDDGATWVDSTIGASLSQGYAIKYTGIAGKEWMIAGTAAAGVGGVWASTDLATWTRVFTDTSGVVGATLYLVKCPGGVMVYGPDDTQVLYFSSDGVHWQRQGRPPQMRDLGTSPTVAHRPLDWCWCPDISAGCWLYVAHDGANFGYGVSPLVSVPYGE